MYMQQMRLHIRSAWPSLACEASKQELRVTLTGQANMQVTRF